MYVEERRKNDILRARRDYLPSIHLDLQSKRNDLQAVEGDISQSRQARAAEKNRVFREYQQHQRDALAFQAEADRLDKEQRAKIIKFQRQEKDLLSRIARGVDDGGQARPFSQTQFQRQYPPQSYRPTLAGFPSSVLASSAAPLRCSSSSDARAYARNAQKQQQQQQQSLFRLLTPIDSVPPVPLQRVQSLLPTDRGPPTSATLYQLIPRSDFSMTKFFAALYDCCENPFFDPEYRAPRRLLPATSLGLPNRRLCSSTNNSSMGVYLLCSKPSILRPSIAARRRNRAV